MEQQACWRSAITRTPLRCDVRAERQKCNRGAAAWHPRYCWPLLLRIACGLLATGHRCPGELITIALLGTFAKRLARLNYYVPPQDLAIDLSRIPARPADGMRIVVP